MGVRYSVFFWFIFWDSALDRLAIMVFGIVAVPFLENMPFCTTSSLKYWVMALQYIKQEEKIITLKQPTFILFSYAQRNPSVQGCISTMSFNHAPSQCSGNLNFEKLNSKKCKYWALNTIISVNKKWFTANIWKLDAQNLDSSENQTF